MVERPSYGARRQEGSTAIAGLVRAQRAPAQTRDVEQTDYSISMSSASMRPHTATMQGETIIIRQVNDRRMSCMSSSSAWGTSGCCVRHPVTTRRNQFGSKSGYPESHTPVSRRFFRGSEVPHSGDQLVHRTARCANAKGPPGNRATLFYGRQLQQRQSYWNSLVQEYGRHPTLSRTFPHSHKPEQINELRAAVRGRVSASAPLPTKTRDQEEGGSKRGFSF